MQNINKLSCKLLKPKTNNGDTIIEVMIAIVIVSVVFGAAFSLASRSTKNSISSRERVEALKLVEGQIEILKTKRGDSTFDNTYRLNGVAPGFCFDTSGAKTISIPTCTVGDVKYVLNITYVTPGTGSPFFHFQATWPSLTGTTNITSIDYRP